MKATLLRRPLLLWLLYAAVIAALGATAKLLWPDLTPGAAGLGPLQVGLQAVLTLLPLPFAAALGWRRAGFVQPRDWMIVPFPVVTVAFGYLGPLRQQPGGAVALAVLLVVLVAVGEETAFRGVLLPLLLPRGTAFASPSPRRCSDSPTGSTSSSVPRSPASCCKFCSPGWGRPASPLSAFAPDPCGRASRCTLATT